MKKSIAVLVASLFATAAFAAAPPAGAPTPAAPSSADSTQVNPKPVKKHHKRHRKTGSKPHKAAA